MAAVIESKDDGSKVLVKWIGWDEATWEPRANLIGTADEALAQFDEAQFDGMALGL